MTVDHLEGGEQPFAAFLVEAADALAEAMDGGDQVVALAGQRVAPRRDLGGFRLGAEVDGAEPFAFMCIVPEEGDK